MHCCQSKVKLFTLWARLNSLGITGRTGEFQSHLSLLVVLSSIPEQCSQLVAHFTTVMAEWQCSILLALFATNTMGTLDRLFMAELLIRK